MKSKILRKRSRSIFVGTALLLSGCEGATTLEKLAPLGEETQASATDIRESPLFLAVHVAIEASVSDPVQKTKILSLWATAFDRLETGLNTPEEALSLLAVTLKENNIPADHHAAILFRAAKELEVINAATEGAEALFAYAISLLQEADVSAPLILKSLAAQIDLLDSEQLLIFNELVQSIAGGSAQGDGLGGSNGSGSDSPGGGSNSSGDNESPGGSSGGSPGGSSGGSSDESEAGDGPIVVFTSPENYAVFNDSADIIVQGICSENGRPVVLTGAVPSGLELLCDQFRFEGEVTLTGGDGVKSLTLTHEDALGNESQDTISITFDSAPPNVSLLLPNSGSLAGATVEVSGLCESLIPVVLTGDILSLTASLSCVSGLFSGTIYLSSGGGNKSITASQIDAAGNLTVTDPLVLVRDVHSPIVTWGSPSVASINSTGSVSVEMSFGDGAGSGVVVPVFDGTAIGQQSIGSASCSVVQVSGTGNISRTISLSGCTGDGTILLVAPAGLIIDQAGNNSQVAGIEHPIGIDNSPPHLSVIDPQENDDVPAAMTIRGLCETGRDVILSNVDIVSSPHTVSCVAGIFSKDLTWTGAGGPKEITLQSSDSLGNSSTETFSVTYDNSPPVVSLTAPLSSTVLTSSLGQSAIEGTCEDGYDVSLSGDIVQDLSVACLAGEFDFQAGTWTISGSDGPKELIVSQTDGVGLIGSDSILVQLERVVSGTSKLNGGAVVPWTATNGYLPLTAPGTYEVTFDFDALAHVSMWGAGGGKGNSITGTPGCGGSARGTVTLDAGSTYVVVVGSSAANGAHLAGTAGGGGDSHSFASGGPGGGYSGLFLSSISQANALIIAGGGGGAGGRDTGDTNGMGGCGGGLGAAGLDHNGTTRGSAGFGGDLTAGGAAGGGSATAGAALAGGDGGIRSTNQGSGGGGGGGYWGGGGGAQGGNGTSGQSGWGGGGGSGFLHPTFVEWGEMLTGSYQVSANQQDPFHLGGVGNPGVHGGVFLLFKPRTSFSRPVLSATYSQSSVYGTTGAASAVNMQSGTLSTSTATNADAYGYVRMDLGVSKKVTKLRLGTCHNGVPGGWSKFYSEGLTVRHSNDATNWTVAFVTPVFKADGIFEFSVDFTSRYVEATKNSYVCITEFAAIGELVTP